MRRPLPSLSSWLRAATLGVGLLALPLTVAAAEPPRGGTLRFLVEQEPTTLVTIAHTAGPCPGVKWHDGKDFTSADVAHSIQLLKQHHPRGRGTFAFVTEVETPDPLTNKNASAPIGTGPFIFKEWVKGSHIIAERNPNYWDAGKPYLDRVVFRFIADQSARSAAFETGELDLGGGPPVARSDLARLQALPILGSETRGYDYNGSITQLYFNYENPILHDKRVRQAIAHAIDTKRLLDTVFFGFGKVAPSAISPYLTNFVDPSIRPYKVDLALANKLLDEVGYPKKADGTRFPIRLYANPYNLQASGDFVKQALTRIGIAVDFQFFDFSTYIQKAYTGREFDITLESLSNTFDPTPGIQRVFWSKNFKIGLPFSNASHYENPVVDQLLEAAAVEPDAAKRKQLWSDFQKVIYDDVAAIHLIAPDGVTLFAKKVKNHTLGVTGINASFADVYFQQS